MLRRYLYLAATPVWNLSSPLEFDWIKDIWAANTSPKLKVFLWYICQGALSIEKNLEKCGMMSQSFCPRCKMVKWSMHLFFHCPFAKQVCQHIPLQQSVHIADDLDIKSALVLFRKSTCLPPTGIKINVLPWVCWSPWNASNKLIFEDKTNHPAEIATKGLVSAREWDQAQSVQKPTKLATSQIRNDPRRDVRSLTPLSCSVDAAWDAATHRAGIAWIMNGSLPLNPWSGYQVINNVAFPFMAEILALQRGIERAIEAASPSSPIFQRSSEQLTTNCSLRKYMVSSTTSIKLLLCLPLSLSSISLVLRTWKLILL